MENTFAPALKLKAEYVSTEDFKTYTGTDLTEQLNEGMNPDFFLRDAENEIIDYVNGQSWRPITRYIHDNCFSPEQVVIFKTAILIQAKYMLENSDLMSDSGVDPEKGVIFGKYERDNASIAPNAINMLKNAGIVTLKMRTKF